MSGEQSRQESALLHLVIDPPDCPYCDAQTSLDGTSYWCEVCGATWDKYGTADSAPTDPLFRHGIESA